MTLLRIGAKMEVFAFRIAMGSGSILDDFVLPFSVSVVTSSSEAGLNASRGEETIHGYALSTLADGRWIWLRIE